MSVYVPNGRAVGSPHVTPPERERFAALLDAMLLSPPLAERLRGCGIDRSFRKGPKPSDHAPLLTELA